MNYTNAKWASFSRRALAFAIDSIILMVLMNILGQVLEESLPKSTIIILTPGIIILLNAILSFRDINGQGIGKRIMKIKVISMRHEDGKLRLNQYIIRYITLFALPAEFWFYWGTQGKERWGDKLAGTKVINVQ